MSRKDKNQNETQEPWEQPIYDTDSETNYSRTSQRKSKNGTKSFLIALVVMLALIVSVPVGAFFWLTNSGGGKADSAQTSKTTETSTKESESSSEESSTEESSSTMESSSTVESSSAAENNQVADGTEQNQTQNEVQGGTQQNTQDQAQQQTGESYTTVGDGEGPNQVAARAGISVEELGQLNGFDPYTTMLHPGQSLRVK